MQKLRDADAEARAAAAALERSLHRGIEYARQFRRAAQRSTSSTDTTVALVQSGDTAVASPAQHSLAVESGVWGALAAIGSTIQQSIYNAAAFSYQHQTPENRLNSVAARLHRSKAVARMSDKATKAVLQAELRQSQLEVGPQGPTISRPMLQLVSASVSSAELLWTGFLNCLGRRLLSGEWKGILHMRRSRYDETPLKIRSKAAVAGSELSQHAKILQSELSLYTLVQHTETKEHLLFFGSVPCPLKLMDRTTAEVTKAAVCADVENVDDAALEDFFQWKLRVATVDRYGANLKAERSILHDSPGWTKYTKACDLHLASQILVKTTELAEKDISGLLSTALSQQGAGVLHILQEGLQQVLRERLIVCYEAPPAGRLQEHREQVLDMFLPVDIEKPSRAVLLRRYIIAALFNGNYARQDVVEHYCVWGCCKDFDHTLRKCSTFGVWALLSSKCPKFPRSRWTNQAQSVSWAGLLACVHNVLEATVLKFTEPLQKKAQPSSSAAASAEALFPALPDLDADPAIADEVEPVAQQAQLLEEVQVLDVEDADAGHEDC